jgi:hypothetical protein
MVQIRRIRILIWSSTSYLQYCVCFQEKQIHNFFLWSVESSYIHYRKFVASSRNFVVSSTNVLPFPPTSSVTYYFSRNMSGPLMSETQFETMRLYLILATLLYRLFLMPKYLQVPIQDIFIWIGFKGKDREKTRTK